MKNGGGASVWRVCLMMFLAYIAWTIPLAVYTDFVIYVVLGGDTAGAAMWNGIAKAVRAFVRVCFCPFQGTMCDEFGRKKFAVFGLTCSYVLGALGGLVPTRGYLLFAAFLNGLFVNLEVPSSIMIVEICRAGSGSDSGDDDLSAPPAAAQATKRAGKISTGFAQLTVAILTGILIGTGGGTVLYKILSATAVDAADMGEANVTNATVAAEAPSTAQCGNFLLNKTSDKDFSKGEFAIPPLVDTKYYPTELVLPGYIGVLFGIGSILVTLAAVRETRGILTSPGESTLHGKSKLGVLLLAFDQFRGLRVLGRNRLVMCWSVAFFLFGMGQEGFLSVILFWLSYKFGFRPVSQMIFLSIGAFIPFLLSNLVILPFLLRRKVHWYWISMVAIFAGFVMGVGLFCATTPAQAFVFTFFPNCLLGYCVPLFKGLISDEFPETEQAKLQGAISSGGSLAPIIYSSAFAYGVSTVDDGNDCAIAAANSLSGLPFLILTLQCVVGFVAATIAIKAEGKRKSAVVVTPKP